MAFQQPTRHSTQRLARPETDGRDIAASRTHERQPNESQTWVLFAPATDITTTSYLSETEQSIQTQPRSILSGSGRLDPAIQSDLDVESRQSSLLSAILDDAVEDDGELDSLDSHLPEFRSLPGIYTSSQNGNQQQTQPILPTHDGLGSFRLDQPMLGADAQDRIYQFERFNPQRVQRRRESLDRAQLELEYEQNQVAEKRQRIEAWRLEHSRILLDDVQRETRRRRQSQAQRSRLQVSDTVLKSQAMGIDAVSDDLTWHDEDAAPQEDESGGILARFTRKMLKDVLDIDDRLLAILLGEAVPDEEELSATPRASQSLAPAVPGSADEQSWQLQMLERVSQELGLLVNQLSQHPGAFSTYTRVQQMPLPYAGLPIIPESGSPPSPLAVRPEDEHPQPSFPEFRPTVAGPALPITIPSRRMDSSTEMREELGRNNTFSQEEWEQDLDIKLVFRYLRSRFTSRWSNSSTSSTSHVATNSTQDMAAKAARVRQHHPLTARARPVERRTFKATTPSSPVALRHHSSCASQSTRRSARRSSCSSRHYWDIGGSLGTGSVIAPTGPMGSWGEV
ncbi:hypothetical protein HJFPF1_03882 [Paramyrothecium foliicola]|nr:hypothetical protein HJFPF1_03882 [Paramyrothecium foliicola]